jgi:hypothetical protein
MKRGLSRNWMRRFVVVADGRFAYFKKKQDLNPAAIIFLEDVHAVSVDGRDAKSGFRFVIKLTTSKKTTTLALDSEESMHHWAVLLEQAVLDIRVFRHENARKAVCTFLAIRRFRARDCVWVHTTCKDVVGIIAKMVWESRFCNALWLF